MKIATENKLAHLQCEYVEIQEKLRLLQSQMAPLQVQVNNLASYVQVNNGDRDAMKRYRKAVSDLNTLNTRYRRDYTRAQSLALRIQQESIRITNQQMKASMPRRPRNSMY